MAIYKRDKKPSENDERQLHHWARDLLEDGHEVRQGWEGQWWENLATYMGDLWSEWNPRDKKLLNVIKKKPKHRVRLPINLAQPAVRTELAKLVKNRPIVDVQAASNDKRDLDAAEVGDKVLGNFVEREYHMGRVRRRMLNHVLVFGCGGIFVDHDPSAGEVLSMLSDDQGNPVIDESQQEMWIQYWKQQHRSPKQLNYPEGDLRQVALTPFQLVYDMSVLDFDKAAWCIVSEVFDVCEVERRWNKEVEAEKNVYPGTIESRLLERYDKVGNLKAKSPSAQKLCQVHRLFVRPGHIYFPDGIHLVFTKDKILLNEKYPYSHGKLPVAWMGHIDMPTSQQSMSVLQQIRGPVLEISRTESQMVENRNMMANPPWLVADQHGLEEGSIQNRPGLRIKYRHVPNVPEPHPVQMPDMPGYVKDIPPMLKEHILEISGQGETSQGQVPAGARSGVAIAYLQESDDTRLGPTVTAFEETIEYWAEITLRTIAEKFDMPRKMVIGGARGDEPEILNWTGMMLASFSGVKVQAGSALPRSKAAKQQFILDLWDRQIEQDPRKVREALELGEGEPDDMELDMEQADRENDKLLKGGDHGVEVKTWHNHAAHLFKHHQHMKSTDFEAADEDIQTEYEEHCADHERELQNQQKAQMQLQGGEDPNAAAGPPGANGGGPPQAAAAPSGGPLTAEPQ